MTITGTVNGQTLNLDRLVIDAAVRPRGCCDHRYCWRDPLDLLIITGWSSNAGNDVTGIRCRLQIDATTFSLGGNLTTDGGEVNLKGAVTLAKANLTTTIDTATTRQRRAMLPSMVPSMEPALVLRRVIDANATTN